MSVFGVQGWIVRRGLTIACAAVASSVVSVGQVRATAVRGGGYVAADGKIQSGGVIIIRDGRIAEVASDAPDDVRVDAYDGAVVSPGLIDVAAALGAYGQLREVQHALQPKAAARDAFDRYSRQLRAALEAGVTGFGLSPDDENLVGGKIAVCRTSGARGSPGILTDSGPLKLSLSPVAFKSDREPTSRGGAIAMFRSALERARGADAGALHALVSGQVRAVFTTPSGADVLAALELAKTFGFEVTLIHNADARHVAEAVARAGASVIVGPYGLFTSPRGATAAGIFEKAGAPVAIAGGLPTRSADSLRIGAAVAVRNGMSPAAARRAITSAPARMLGVADHIGSLQEGRQADLVVFSGDPLDLRSRVLAVYIEGRRVYAAQRE